MLCYHAERGLYHPAGSADEDICGVTTAAGFRAQTDFYMSRSARLPTWIRDMASRPGSSVNGHVNRTGTELPGEALLQNGVTAQGDGLAWQSGIIPTTFCGGALLLTRDLVGRSCNMTDNCIYS